jgi:hypothetical protein
VETHISKKLPKNIKYSVDARFDEKVVLLGYNLDKTEVRRGDRFKITWYWQCIDGPGPGWRLFTHIHDARGKAKLNRDKVGAIRKYFQPEHWEPGLVIEDVQEVAVPLDWESNVLELRTGLWKGSRRLEGSGTSIGKSNNAKGPRMVVKPAAPMRTMVPYTEKAPIIDGDFEREEAWRVAAQLAHFRQTMSGMRVKGATAVRLMWDDENLYVAMRANDDYLMSQYREHDDELWHEDAFEIFLDPEGDARDYYELQVNPAGVVFDAFLPAYRKNQNEWTSNVIVQVRLQGDLNKEDGDDRAWLAELAIPFSALKKQDSMPPKSGDTWRANFFRIDKMEKDKHYSAWSPPLRGDFHALDKFGHLTFINPKGQQPSEIE